MTHRRNRLYAGPVTDHFDGIRFFDPASQRGRGFLDFLKWRWSHGNPNWPEPGELPDPAFAVPPSRVDGDRLLVTNVGHATVLIQTRGLNMLTDPIWSERAGPFSWTGPRRRRPPGVRFADLPAIDLVFVSHSHYDHMDLPTLARLHERDAPLMVMPLGNDAIIRERIPAARTEALDWGGRLAVAEGVDLHLVPLQHWSRRTTRDTNHALWGGLVVETPGGNLYAAPDTGFAGGRPFRLARERFGRFRFAILPIGAYEPRWFMEYAHMSPEEALDAAAILGADQAMAIHYNVFPLADEDYDAAPRRLEAARARNGFPPEFLRDLEIGGVWDVPALLPAQQGAVLKSYIRRD